MARRYFVGIDVGTRSARAGVFDETGVSLATASHDITLHLGPGDRAEQSSSDIWQAVCFSVSTAVRNAGIFASDVAGIGFDATCSLVVLGDGAAPLPIGDSGDDERNVIVWMDHRALNQAERINAAGHSVLQYVGGRISPEMQTPKLLWLRENKPDVFANAWQFFDLPDFLTWKATGNLARSTCTVTCKWTYLAHEQRWDASYFASIGLGSLAEEGFSRIGTDIVAPGTAIGQGLTVQAALELGLESGTPVAAALIDAHAGGIGTVGARGAIGSVTSRIAYVFGTSACTMVSTENPRMAPGVWGPYYSAMVPGVWLLEGGQSAAGSALDHLVTLHPAAALLEEEARAANETLVALLSKRATGAVSDMSDAANLAGDLHVVPEFLGNRSPYADPLSRALIAGLGMDKSPESLVALYVAGVLGLGYGVRQILDVSRAAAVFLDAIAISGGAGKSPLIRQLLADATGLPVLVTAASEPVLLGSSMLGAVAAGVHASLSEAMQAMSSIEDVAMPSERHSGLHSQRYDAFRELQTAGRRIRGLGQAD
ncbi:FGGY-family carbohydrate kinase [Devosia sp. A369]